MEMDEMAEVIQAGLAEPSSASCHRDQGKVLRGGLKR